MLIQIKKLFKLIIYRIIFPLFLKSRLFNIIFDHYSIFKNGNIINIQNLFGFNIYQNSHDIVNYSKFANLSIKNAAKLEIELDYIYNNVANGSKVIDVGANIGFYTFALSKIVGENGNVYSFEPGPVSYALLSRNIYTNLSVTKNIKAYNNIVSDDNGIGILDVCTSGESDNQVVTGKQKNNDSQIEIKKIKLDDIISDECKNNISYIKVDTQGHEYYVLKGAKNIIEASKCIKMSIEFAPYLPTWNNFTIEDMYRLIKGYDLKIYDIINLNIEVDLDYLQSNYQKNLKKYTTLILEK